MLFLFLFVCIWYTSVSPFSSTVNLQTSGRTSLLSPLPFVPLLFRLVVQVLLVMTTCFPRLLLPLFILSAVQQARHLSQCKEHPSNQGGNPEVNAIVGLKIVWLLFNPLFYTSFCMCVLVLQLCKASRGCVCVHSGWWWRRAGFSFKTSSCWVRELYSAPSSPIHRRVRGKGSVTIIGGISRLCFGPFTGNNRLPFRFHLPPPFIFAFITVGCETQLQFVSGTKWRQNFFFYIP